MNTALILGRGVHLPTGTDGWLMLAAVLTLTAIALLRVADLPLALLGIVASLASYAFDKHLFIAAAIAGMSALAWLTGKRSPSAQPARRALREGLYIGSGFFLYEQGRAIFVGNEAEAQHNAGHLLALERRLHLAFEPALQRPVLSHETALTVLNGIYSYAFLPFVMGTLFWLLLTDAATYRLLRDALGISIVIALPTIALFPVAPPRLLPGSKLVDTHVLVGRWSHGFVNPFAAVPSFHVGWMALCGVALLVSLRGPLGWLAATLPVSIMSLTVMLTGNHYWLDGVIGSAFTLVPLLVLTRLQARDWEFTPAVRRSLRWTQVAVRNLWVRPFAGWSIASISVLLAYLLIRKAFQPDFAHYWGYMIAQTAATIAILVYLEAHFWREGGLSWLTYAVVVASTWADTLGTAGHMYDRFTFYDKVVHFGGGLAITAVAADLLCARQRKLGIPQHLPSTLKLATGISLFLTAGWEVYEYFGDIIFSTGRWRGAWDTIYDLIFDSLGTAVALFLLNEIEPRRFPENRGARLLPTPLRKSAAPVHARGTATTRGYVRWLLFCGLVAPLEIVGFTVFAAAYSGGYSHVSSTVSNLAAQGEPHALVMRAGMVLFGSLIMLFAAGVATVLPSHASPLRLCLEVFGGSVVMAGVFQDYSRQPGHARNAEGFLHNTFAIVAVVGLLGALVLAARIAQEHAAWSRLFWLSVVSSGIVVLTGMLLLSGPNGLQGLFERALYVAALTWLVSLARTALRAVAPAGEPAGARSQSSRWHPRDHRPRLHGH